MGYDIEIFADINPRENITHPDIDKYELNKKVHYLDIPTSIPKRIIKASILFIKNIHRDPLKILNSLNFLRYGKSALSLEYFFLILPFLDKHFNVIHCHFGQNGIRGIFLKNLEVTGKIITSFHGYDANSYPKLKGNDVYKNLFFFGDIFTCNTNFTKNQITSLGCNPNKIVILPVGLKLDKFPFFERKLPADGNIKILTVGRLVEKKGHEYMIRALAEIFEKYENIEYLIVGSGPLENELKELVVKLKISDKVVFLINTEDSELLNLYQEAEIFVLPSVTAKNGDREGQALVLQEAQATGLPVISTFHNGIPEGVIDGKSGFLVPERDVDALADKLISLINHPEMWPEMGRCGREFVEKKYDIHTLNSKLIEIYKNLLNE
jgi:colanic acid/amylovoran biosynthesis glycosyltransferase